MYLERMRALSISHEILAGLSTFFTLSYFFVLYPQILASGGWDIGAALTASILAIAFGSCFLGLSARFPIAIGPLLSEASYLVFNAELKASIEELLGLVFWAGGILFLLSLLKLRQTILIQIPDLLKQAASVGIGFFFIAIALKQAGVIEITATGYALGQLGSFEQLIALLGTLLFFFLHYKGFKGAFLIPILFCWIFALVIGSAAWKGIAAMPPSLKPSLFQLDFKAILNPSLWSPLLSILLIALFDSSATLTALSRMLGWIEPDGSIRRINRAVIPDGLTSMFAALLGATSCSFFAESSSGIRSGGKTAVTACTIALCSLSVLFLFPLISSIPFFATVPALFGVGSLMAGEWLHLDKKRLSDWIPFLITALTMPLFFSIYWGFACGFISFVLVKLIARQHREIKSLTYALAFLFAAHAISQWI